MFVHSSILISEDWFWHIFSDALDAIHRHDTIGSQQFTVAMNTDGVKIDSACYSICQKSLTIETD